MIPKEPQLTPAASAGLLRASEEPSPHPPRRSIDPASHVGKHLGDVLDLVKDRRQADAIKEALRIGAEAGHEVRRLER